MSNIKIEMNLPGLYALRNDPGLMEVLEAEENTFTIISLVPTSIPIGLKSASKRLPNKSDTRIARNTFFVVSASTIARSDGSTLKNP